MEKKIDLKSNKKYGLIFLGTLVITLVCFFSYVMLDKNADASTKEAQNYNDLIADDKDEEKMVAEFTFVSQPYFFAVYEDDGVEYDYYMVFDEYGYLYIVRLTDDTYTKIMSEYEINPDEFSYTIKGYLFNTEDDLKKLAMDYYNESYEEEIINEDNFKVYFGKTYLDETHTPEDAAIGILIGLFIAGAVFSIIFFVIWIAFVIITKKTLKRYNLEELEYEIQKSSTIKYPKLKLYISDKYIISNNEGLKVVPIEDVIWIHVSKLRVQGFININRLLVYNTKFKTIEICESLGKKELMNEIINIIKEKNDKVLVGYTKENQQEYKRLKKQK